MAKRQMYTISREQLDALVVTLVREWEGLHSGDYARGGVGMAKHVVKIIESARRKKR